MQIETRYAKSGDVHIAYQVVGQGPIDLVHVIGWVSHLEYGWESPSLARFHNRLASFSRLILIDKRGTGLSDRVADLPTLEQRMDDLRAVMDAVGSEQVALFEARRISGAPRDKTVDPVCGMELHTSEVAARLDVGGQTLTFCSTDCLQRFVAAPEQYVH